MKMAYGNLRIFRRKIMRKGIFLILILSILLALFAMTGSLLASEGIIYIAETEIANKVEKSKTLISKFKPDGTELKKIYVNGIMARVSPDGKKIIYLEHTGYVDPASESEPIWEIAIADESGEKIKNLPTFFNKEDKEMMDTVKLAWSPDGKKIAILQYLRVDLALKHVGRCLIVLKILDLTTTELINVYTTEVKVESYSQRMEKAYAYVIEWFPDNNRILLTGAGGTELIDIKSKISQVIVKDAVNAHSTTDGKEIIYILGAPWQFKVKNPDIWQYDIKKQNNKKLFTLDISFGLLIKSVLSHDNRLLAFHLLEKPNLYIVDLLSKKISEIFTEKLFLLPMKFSPQKNNLLICIGMEASPEEMESTINYGIFDLKSKEYRKLKKAVKTPSGEGLIGYLLFIDIMDWVDWRRN